MKKAIKNLIFWASMFCILDIVLVGAFAYSSVHKVSFDYALSSPILLIQGFKSKELIKVFLNYQGLYILGFMILLGYFYSHKKDLNDNTTHGSARWANTSEIKDVLNNKSGIVLANKMYLDMNSPLNKNIAIIGSSGSGKSSGFIKPNVLQMNGSYIITDPKGEIFDDTSAYLKENGYVIKVLNLVNLNASDLYNPLAYIKSHEDIQILAKTIISNTSSGISNIEDDSFWANAEMTLLTALISYVAYMLPENQRNLTSVLNLLLEGSSEEKLDEIFSRLPQNHIALNSYKLFSLSGDSKTRGNIMIGLGVRLQVLQNEGLSRLTSIDTLNLKEVGKNKTALYIITSDSHRTYDFISSMLFSQVFQILYREADLNGGILQEPVLCLLDEFSNIGRIPDFSSKVSSMRSRGISVSIVLQSLGQLKGRYNKDWADILGNCDTLLFLGTQDIETAKFISERLGKATIINKTKSYSTRIDKGSSGSKTENEGKTGRSLLAPDEVTRLSTKKSIIFINGTYPILTKKYEIKLCGAYTKFVKANHSHYCPEVILEYEVTPENKVFEPKPDKEKVKKKLKPKSEIKTSKEETTCESTDIFENADFGR